LALDYTSYPGDKIKEKKTNSMVSKQSRKKIIRINKGVENGRDIVASLIGKTKKKQEARGDPHRSTWQEKKFVISPVEED